MQSSPPCLVLFWGWRTEKLLTRQQFTKPLSVSPHTRWALPVVWMSIGSLLSFLDSVVATVVLVRANGVASSAWPFRVFPSSIFDLISIGSPP